MRKLSALAERLSRTAAAVADTAAQALARALAAGMPAGQAQLVPVRVRTRRRR